VPDADTNMTLAQAFERYYEAKTRKRSLDKDRQHAAHLLTAFGESTKLRALTAARISAWRDKKLAAKSKRGGPLAAASINRPLSILRCLLRLAHDEWGVIPSVPKIRLLKEPEGRIRWLEPDEEARLLNACEKSRNPYLLPIVTVALESGLRKGELLALTWERVDLSRGVIRLEITKSGKRREVPMRQAVYNVITGLPGPRTGHVWPNPRLRTGFDKAVEEAKIEDLHFHDCRHHFASWFVMRGGKIEVLQKILGHQTLEMTMRYAHLAPGFVRDEMVKTERPVDNSRNQGTRNVEPTGLTARGES